MRSLSLAFTLLFVVIASGGAFAQGEKGIWPDEITLDGQIFKKEQLNQAFLDAVFTKDVLNEYNGRLNLALPANILDKDLSSPENIKREYPWIYPHIYPQSGLPRLLAINKWAKPVRITFGMPNDLRPFVGDQNKTNHYKLEYRNLESLQALRESPMIQALAENISGLSQHLSDLTGQKISYRAYEQETKNDLAEIRINIISSGMASKQGDPKYRYKLKDGLRYGLASWEPDFSPFRSAAERIIKTGFVFTADSRKQVDGYILTNAKNEIEMAYCYIWEDHDMTIMKALINECIIRSLGLPGAVRFNYSGEPVPESFISLWNDLESWPKALRPKVRQPSSLSDFDQYIIRTLYDPAIKPGMDYVSAQKVLLGSNFR